MSDSYTALLVFPHQLFEDILSRPKTTRIILVEDGLFFRQFAFHKQKLVLHRASMSAFADRLESEGFMVEHIRTAATKSMTRLQESLTHHNIDTLQYYDLVDDWLEQQVHALIQTVGLKHEVFSSPGFLTTRGAIDEYFSKSPKRMQSFYVWQRKRLDVLVEDGKPVGGKWSFDQSNRKRIPKGMALPEPYSLERDEYTNRAISWVMEEFPDNVGTADTFRYAVTHQAARGTLEQFLESRLELFGPYEDAIVAEQSQLFHSILSPLLNIGLITPRQVVRRTLQFAKEHDTPIESLEGFIRQIIGWREYMRATYMLNGRQMRSQNQLEHTRKLDAHWWDGTTGIIPIDQTIKRVVDTAYAHHIERLMVFGNSMLLLRIDPDEVYKWFMVMFIDAYDWVMVPNVYAMSQYSVKTMITTKPYVSGSNYIRKMSDHKSGEWCDVWDALYWRFIADHRQIFEHNFRSAMMVKLYDRLMPDKKARITKLSDDWLMWG